MRFTFASLTAFVAYVAAQSPPTIATPASLVQCQPALISWKAINQPVIVSAIPGGQPGAVALEELGSQIGDSLTWIVNLAAGTNVTMQIRDSTGVLAYSGPSVIQGSSDSSCVGQSPSGSSSGSISASASSTSAVAGSSSAAQSSAAVSSSMVESSSSASGSSSSVEASTSSVIASVSSVVASVTSRPTSTAPSTSRSASATSASASASSSANAARSNTQVGFAGLLGLVAAAFMA